MINLIPPEGHAIVRWEYRLRVASALAFLFGGVFLSLTIALIPTYVLVSAQIKTLDHDDEARSLQETYEHTKKAVDDAHTLLTHKLIIDETVDASAIIHAVEGSASNEIVVNSFYIDTNSKPPNIQIQGVATTRTALAQFKTTLENHALFSHAELPVADLARESELPFAITLTLADKKTP